MSEFVLIRVLVSGKQPSKLFSLCEISRNLLVWDILLWWRFAKELYRYAYHIDDPKQRDDASAAEALLACELGASVIRTHNVPLTVTSVEENLRPYVFIGMGCNVALVADEGEELEGKKAMLNQAISDMCMLPDSQIIDVSSFTKVNLLISKIRHVRQCGSSFANRFAAARTSSILAGH
mgnify:CR=1 FL=1